MVKKHRTFLPGTSPGTRDCDSSLLLAVLALLLLGGCATGSPRGALLSGARPRPPTPAFLADTGPRHEAPPEEAAGSGGGFFEEKADAFQGVQEASGLEEEERHPAGAPLYLEQARQLLGRLVKKPVTPRSFAPRRALFWLLGEVLEGGERVEYAELVRRTWRFSHLVAVRPDGYGVEVLSGKPLQRLGQVKLEEGEWRVGNLVVGDFYFSHGGVLYPVNDVLRRAHTPPWAELGLVLMVTRKRRFLVMGRRELPDFKTTPCDGFGREVERGGVRRWSPRPRAPRKTEGPPEATGGPSWRRALVCESGGPMSKR
jgi:hypothetical protein